MTGQCSCGCPTEDLQVADRIPAAESQDNPIGDALGEVDGNRAGVMLSQSGGRLACLEVYDLSDSKIPRPFGQPDLKSLRPFRSALPHLSRSGKPAVLDVAYTDCPSPSYVGWVTHFH